MIQFIKNKRFYKDYITRDRNNLKTYVKMIDARLYDLVKFQEGKDKKFTDLMIAHSELMMKHDELIQHMTQFFITSEKIKLAEDRRKQEIEKERTATPADYKY